MRFSDDAPDWSDHIGFNSWIDAVLRVLVNYIEFIYFQMARLIARNARIVITEKPIGWRGSSLADVRALPERARREIGHQLSLLQRGQQPMDWKPMSRVGPGTIEVRVHLETELRVLVVCKFAEAIYVLHAFIKRSQQTAVRDIQLATDRYRALAKERS